MKKKGFTLVELLAVIAILAIILLIAVPMILGVIEDARQDSFRNSVRGVFHAIELKNAMDGDLEGKVEDLDLSGEKLTGSWEIVDGEIILTNVCSDNYCISTLEDSNKGTDFTVSTSEGEKAEPTPDPVYLTSKFTGDSYQLKNVGTSNEANFFVGANPNNWVYFDGILWRVIKSDSEGIKIIYELECDDPATCTAKFEGYLEEGGLWYDDPSTTNKWETDEMKEDWNSARYVLSSWYEENITTTSLINPVNWCIGGIPNNAPTTLATILASECVSSTNDNGEFPGKTVDKTGYGFIRVSDYMSTSSNETCSTTYDANGSGTDYCGAASDGTVHSFLYEDYSWWTMNPNSSTSTNVWYIDSVGTVDYYYYGATGPYAGLRPVINLKPTVQYDSGQGTRTNPYTIK